MKSGLLVARRVIGLVALSLAATGLPAYGGQAVSGGGSSVEPSKTRVVDHDIWGISHSAVDNAWAVGYNGPENGLYFSVTRHWDGSQWRTVQSPNPGGQAGQTALFASATPGQDDAWAAGLYRTDSQSLHSYSLILHWDGKDWTQETSLSPASGDNFFNNMDAISPTDVYAFGYACPIEGGPARTPGQLASHAGVLPAGGATSPCNNLVEHYDGTAWQAEPDSFANIAESVAGPKSSDVWAAGSTATSGQPVIEHSADGRHWTVVYNPSIQGNLTDIAWLSDSDVWAIGSQGNSPLCVHWDGHTWQQTSMPIGPGVYNVGTRISADSDGHLWAIMDGYNTYLLESWDGSSWQAHPYLPANDLVTMHDIDAVNSTMVWAGGNRRRDPYIQRLLLEWNGAGWRQARN